MNKHFDKLPPAARDKLRETKEPQWESPMLATLTQQRFSDENWVYERKLDGERCPAFVSAGEVRLLSRNKKELNAHYPELADALAAQAESDCIVDGEVVAFKSNLTSFTRLQKRMHITNPEVARKSDVAVFFYIFDLLYLDGFELTELPLRRRKVVLKQALHFDDPLCFVTHRNTEGMDFFNEACEFEEWTQHDKLRQPRFLGLREDKAAHDVVRETSQV